jgi:hypothetical protein
MEDSVSGQYVTQKLQHKGEDFAPAGQTSYGKQQTRDLANQGPNTGPLADKESTLPQDTDPKHDIPDNPLMDVFDSAGEPDNGLGEPDNQGEPVDEKLQLKKEASAMFARLDEISALGQQITDYMMTLVAAEKNASLADSPVYNSNAVLNDIKAQQNTPIVTENEIKLATADMCENMLYAAEATALALANSIKDKQVKQAEGEQEVPPQQELGAEEAMGAMSQPTGLETGGPDDISEEEANQLMSQSLAANGVSEGDLGGGGLGDIQGELGAGGEAGLGGGEGEIDISPEELALFEQAMQEAGVTPEDVEQAVAEMQAEQGAGVSPEDAAVAEEEALKTGHYKFASLIPQRESKTADQEKRSALIRGMIRDFYYGPAVTNFN